jgi:hypothetical protein
MIRNLKALGLALVAVFALSAVVASAASAQVKPGTLTSTGPVTLIGTQTAPVGEEDVTKKNFLSAFGGTTTCATAKYTGHKALTLLQTEDPETKKHELIPNDVSEITITPHYGVCNTKILASNFPTTVDMNGCDYTFDLKETTPGVDTYTVRATVICPKDKHITITIFATAAKHTSNEPFCHVTITENAAGYLGLHATDTTNGKIDITGTVAGISADKKSPTGSILCPEETTNTAELTQDVTVEGKNEAGGATTISLSHL